MPKTIKIDPKGYYTLQDIVRGDFFPWARSFWSVRNAVALDSQGKNVLKALIQGEGRAKKYHFKGENIIRFVKAVEAGKVRL
jgi:hypothetical protein